MATNRINFLSSDFSFAPAVKKATLLDTIKKFLVTGFDPFTIEKITVTNKVARVITTEKNFYAVPGIKLAIAGTGVSTIDDRQELEEIFLDGFSFKVDTPNATFTNGLTYFFPSLGWNIVKQSSTELVFKSGGLGTVFYICIRETPIFTPSYKNSEYTQFFVTMSYDIDLLGNLKNPMPYASDDYWQYVLPCLTQTPKSDSARFNLNLAYYFYGDESFFLQGNRHYSSKTAAAYNRHFSSGGFGLSSSVNGEEAPIFISMPILSIVNINSYYYDVGENRSFSQITNGLSNGSVSYSNGLILYKDVLKRSYPIFSQISYIKRASEFYSGSSKRLSTNFKNLKNIVEYSKMEVQDTIYNVQGYVPGVYGLLTKPNVSFLNNNHQAAVLPTRNGKVKRGVYVKSSIVDAVAPAAPVVEAADEAVTFLDLTGPIR